MPSFEVLRHDLADGTLLVTGAFFVSALITKAVGDSASRIRRVALGLSGGLFAAAEILPRDLGHNWIALGLQLAALAVAIGAQFLRNRRLRPRITAAATLVILVVEAFELDGGLTTVFWALGLYVAVAGLYWLMKLSDKHFPSPEARGAAEVLRLRAERRAELRNDHA